MQCSDRKAMGLLIFADGEDISATNNGFPTSWDNVCCLKDKVKCLRSIYVYMLYVKRQDISNVSIVVRNDNVFYENGPRC